jgi:hypothetical protein
MKSRHLWPALILILATNALVLTGAARNRIGAPEALLTLTERELVVSTGHDRDENSGVSLHLNWNRDDGIKKWFDRDKLTELGIDLPPVPSEATDFRRPLPKKAYLVLEYQGPAWLRFKAQKEQELTELEEKLRQEKIDEPNAENQRYRIERALQAESRLFAVDAGTDPRRLRQRYPNNYSYLIVAALVNTSFDYRDKQQILRGRVDRLLVADLHVPRELHTPLLGLPPTHFNYRYDGPEETPRPRYEVEVRWGRQYEPWVTKVRLIGTESTK